MFQKFICTACGHEWELPPVLGNQEICPSCSREKVRRIDAGIRQQELGRSGATEECGGSGMGQCQ